MKDPLEILEVGRILNMKIHIKMEKTFFRQCPECKFYLDKRLKKCFECGYEFPEDDRRF